MGTFKLPNQKSNSEIDLTQFKPYFSLMPPDGIHRYPTYPFWALPLCLQINSRRGRFFHSDFLITFHGHLKTQACVFHTGIEQLSGSGIRQI